MTHTQRLNSAISLPKTIILSDFFLPRAPGNLCLAFLRVGAAVGAVHSCALRCPGKAAFH